MTKPRCDFCKWWKKPLSLRDGWGSCNRTESSLGEPKMPTLAFATDDWEDQGARLKTRPDFGCVMFEDRE